MVDIFTGLDRHSFGVAFSEPPTKQNWRTTCTRLFRVSINGGVPSDHPFLDGIFHHKPSITRRFVVWVNGHFQTPADCCEILDPDPARRPDPASWMNALAVAAIMYIYILYNYIYIYIGIYFMYIYIYHIHICIYIYYPLCIGDAHHPLLDDSCLLDQPLFPRGKALWRMWRIRAAAEVAKPRGDSRNVRPEKKGGSTNGGTPTWYVYIMEIPI